MVIGERNVAGVNLAKSDELPHALECSLSAPKSCRLWRAVFGHDAQLYCFVDRVMLLYVISLGKPCRLCGYV